MSSYPERMTVLLAIIMSCVGTHNGWAADDLEVPQVKEGLTQEIEDFKDPDLWIRHDLWVETEFDSDGDGRLDRMHVDVTRPRQTDTLGIKLPVIYVSSPYFAGTGADGKEYLWDVRHELGEQPPQHEHPPAIERKDTRPIISKDEVKQWVPHGYAVVHSASPGTGFSQGFPSVNAENETLATKAVIDWLNGRASGYATPEGDESVVAYWSTGKVGMTGTSYPGSLAVAAATTGVEGLELIIPVAPNTSQYHYYRSNGLVRHPYGYLGEDLDCLYDFIQSNPDVREESNRIVRDTEFAQNLDRVTGDYSDFWAERDYLRAIDSVKCAVFMSHGFNDWNVVPEHSYRIYQALKDRGVPCKIYYHQGGHGGPPPDELVNKWWGHYLHGIENDVMEGPRAYIVREDAKPSEPNTYDDYPNPAAESVTFHLIGGAPERGRLVTAAEPGQGTETLIDNFSFNGEALAQAEWTQHRLIYLTEELQQPLHISGVPRITIKLASSKPAANLSVWLVSLPWNRGWGRPRITDNLITRGWADPQNYRSLEESEPLEPGQFYEMSFDLQPDDQIIAKGQQIGLMIFSSDKDFTLWPDPGTELTVDLDATTLTLPVVGGAEAFALALEPVDPNEDDTDR